MVPLRFIILVRIHLHVESNTYMYVDASHKTLAAVNYISRDVPKKMKTHMCKYKHPAPQNQKKSIPRAFIHPLDNFIRKELLKSPYPSSSSTSSHPDKTLFIGLVDFRNHIRVLFEFVYKL